MDARTRTYEEPPTAVRCSREVLLARYLEVRAATERLCEPLEAEDQVVQSMPDASPTRWHRAHTSWFFETFVLKRELPEHRPIDPRYEVLFNSYYNSVGEQFPRPRRGLLTRPTVREVGEYRAHVDRGMERLLERADEALLGRVAPVVELGVNHEQQHQELILTDLKHALSFNPLRPSYVRDVALAAEPEPAREAAPVQWIDVAGGLHEIGHAGAGFAFDNESPRHRRHLEPFRIASRPVTEGDWLRFVEDGGYRRAELWFADGWAVVNAEGWRAPLYWTQEGGAWTRFTLRGERPLVPSRPVAHLSYYEAAAYAEWAGARLPTEAEWEVAASGAIEPGAFADDELYDPRPLGARASTGAARMLGDVWEWTASAYEPYPGYRPAAGALGEYNGKFMCSQLVLRGGSCATPRSHIRTTYRNFFYPHQRWQFTGLRLAADT